MRVYLVLFFCSGVSSQFNYFTSSEENEKNDWIDSKYSFISTVSDAVNGLVESGKKTVNKISDRILTSSNDQLNTDSTETKICTNERDDAGLIFLSRFINIFLRKVGLKDYSIEEGKEKEIVTVDISVSRKSLDTLQRFSGGEKVPFNELDESFVSLFGEPTGYPKTQMDYHFWNSFNFILLLGVILAVVIYQCFFLVNKMTKYLFLFTLFFVYYSLCVGHSLWIQYEDAYAKRIFFLEESMDIHGNAKIPNACFPSKQSFWERIKTSIFFSNDDSCKKYMDSKKSIFSELNFEEAFTRPFHGLFFQSIPYFGHSAGKGLKLFTEHFGFPLNILLPVLIPYFFLKYFFTTILHFFHMSIFRRMKGFRDFGSDEKVNENRTQLPSSSCGPVYHITNASTVNISQAAFEPAPIANERNLTLTATSNGANQQSFLNSSHLPDLFSERVKDTKDIIRKNQKQKTDKKYVTYLHCVKSLKEQRHLRGKTLKFSP